MFISPAFAQATEGAQRGGETGTIIMMVALFAIFYFILIRPQQKKVKEHRAMIVALQKGEEVATAGGMVGRITKLDEMMLTLEIAPDIEVLVQRAAVTQLLPKGTIKDF